MLIKILRRIFFTFLFGCAVLFMLKGWIYRQAVTYKSIGTRQAYVITNADFKSLIQEQSLRKTMSIDEIISTNLQLTSHQLNFVFAKSDTDPNKLLITRKAHCVGYASFFTTLINNSLKTKNLSNNYKVEHHIGELYFFGYNIHSFFDSAFFKDHDFVLITNTETGDIFAIDPTVYDYLKIKSVTYTP